MKNFVILMTLLILVLNINIYSQTASKKGDVIVAEIGKNKITAAELEKAYKKNMSRSNDNLFKMSRDSIMDFLNLYINFKLKVEDAIERGFLKDSAVIAEIEQNRKILSESFYYDKVLTEPNVNKFLKMREKEYQVEIILANIKQNADQIDTVEAYAKIKAALGRIKNGESFEEIAKTYSDDPETGRKGGLIPTYITSGKIQRPLEDAIYQTKPGEIYPQIVRTSYGYFLIKVLQVKERKLIRLKHILIAINDSRDSLTAYHKADSLLKIIRKGGDFAKLAKENSDDVATAVNDGDLGGYYSRSTGMETSTYPLVTDFENTVFALKDGEISEAVHTSFGFHIIKRDSTKMPDLKAEYDELRRIYKRLYFKNDQTELLDSLKKLYNFKIYDDVLFQFASFLDSNGTNLAEKWDKDVPDRIQPNIIYEINNQKIKVGDFIDKIKTDPKLKGISLNANGLRSTINALADITVFNEATKNLEKDYPDFQALMKEFRDGILLFKVEAMEVWDKMKFDSTLARTYYDSTKTRYISEDTYDISEIYLLDKNTADSVYNRVKSGENFEEVASKETQRSGYREKKGEWGKVNIRTNNLAKYAKEQNAKTGQILPPFSNEPGYSILKINEYYPPRHKTFEEAIPDFSPQYQEILQNRLTKTWLDTIKKKNTVKINEKELNKLISENN